MEACTTVNRNIEVLWKKVWCRRFHVNITNALFPTIGKKSFLGLGGVTGCPLYSRPCVRFRFPQIKMGNIHIVAKLKISHHLKKTILLLFGQTSKIWSWSRQPAIQVGIDHKMNLQQTASIALSKNSKNSPNPSKLTHTHIVSKKGLLSQINITWCLLENRV